MTLLFTLSETLTDEGAYGARVHDISLGWEVEEGVEGRWGEGVGGWREGALAVS